MWGRKEQGLSSSFLPRLEVSLRADAFGPHKVSLCGVSWRGVAQPGSASALGAEGRRFESCLPDHFRVQRPTCDISMTEAADQPAGHRVSHQGRDMTILKRGAALLLFLVAACAAAPATPQPGV